MRKKQQLAALLAAASLLMTAGCGKGQSPPGSYAAGEISLPSLNQSLGLGDDVHFKMVSNEDDSTSYQYSDLDSGAEAVRLYAQDLTDNYQCAFLDQDGGRLSSQDLSAEFSADSGTVIAAKEAEDESGLFRLSITWEKTSCTVTPSFTVGETLPAEEPEIMTMEEAVTYLRSMPSQYLGLEEEMSAYDIFPEDGVALLDGQACLCLNVYLSETSQYQATYLIVGPQNQIYRLDRETGEATPLS